MKRFFADHFGLFVQFGQFRMAEQLRQTVESNFFLLTDFGMFS